MANHINLLANIFYGISPTDLCRAAYEFAEHNGIKHTFNKHSRMAGRDWLNGFLRRNPFISVRKPETISVARIKGFNKTEVSQFFSNLEEVRTKHKFSPSNVCNVDETGIETIQEPGNILAPKGQKRVGSVTSWERGKNITVIASMNAVGTYVPPMFIFPPSKDEPCLRERRTSWSNIPMLKK
ncbi:hypothetical protein ANN_03370 [Periplaneta americana]|uniref:HTH CENPB-type domain-containing protein n=1 Tax=Periplaneta americana TaxID=6978 RepID=A0ABQ8U2C2_PERAM|nr:hypothetical protein ANN_03370 [Periplaneta americana]